MPTAGGGRLGFCPIVTGLPSNAPAGEISCTLMFVPATKPTRRLLPSDATPQPSSMAAGLVAMGKGDAVAPVGENATVDRRPGKKGAPDAAKISDVRAKECPSCKSLAALNAQTCAFCGHEWTMDKARHGAEADDVAILSRDLRNQPPDEIAVVTWMARRHVKAGSPDSLRVTYSAGLMSYPEWVLLCHSGPGRYRAEKWWAAHGGLMPVPDSVEEALVRWSELSQPSTISVRRNGKWWNVTGRTFHAKQEAA